MYKLKESIKYKGHYYRLGEEIEVATSDIEELERRNIICKASEQPVRSFHTVDEQEPEKEIQIDYNELTKDELKVMLDNKGIGYTTADTKAELIDKLAR